MCLFTTTSQGQVGAFAQACRICLHPVRLADFEGFFFHLVVFIGSFQCFPVQHSGEEDCLLRPSGSGQRSKQEAAEGRCAEHHGKRDYKLHQGLRVRL